MKWTGLFLALIITILYIPMVFMGTNVFFPAFDEPYPGRGCFRAPSEDVDRAELDACLTEEKATIRAYEKERRQYDSWKYIVVVSINLIVLLILLFATLDSSVVIGLFLGLTIATFIATVRYLDTRSKLGFGVLVGLFVLTIYFITKHKKVFMKRK